MTKVTIDRELLAQCRHVLAGCTAIHRLHDDDLDDVKAQIDAALQAAPAQPVNQVLVEALKKHGTPPGDWACKECRPNSDMLKAGFQCIYHAALANAQAQPAQGLTDGERYRWLRKQKNEFDEMGCNSSHATKLFNVLGLQDDWDAAIDAAIQKGQQS